MTTAKRTSYEEEIITRSAPRWAWDVIDETLALDAISGGFDSKLRNEIHDAIKAIT